MDLGQREGRASVMIDGEEPGVSGSMLRAL